MTVSASSGPDLSGLGHTGVEFLKAVWELQPDGYFAVVFRTYEDTPEIERSDWLTFFYTKERFDQIPNEFPEKCDVYFCPAAFSSPSRKKEAVLPSRWLFADLDWVDPHDAVVLPTVAWETSPRKYQALWLLEYAVEREDLRSMNKALCRASGADPGTWNENRLLRVPGSNNEKWRRNRANGHAK